VDGQDAFEAHVVEFHTTRGRAPSPGPSRDECEPDAVCNTALVAGDGNDRYGSDDVPTDTASNTGLANIKPWKLLGGLLSQIDSLGWSDSECLSWIRQKAEAIQSGSGCMANNGNKRRATETLGLDGIKRPRLVFGRNDTDADTAVGADGSTATSDTDGDDDDGSDWGASDDSDCFSVTGCDDENGDRETLATVFETLKKRAAMKMANRPVTQSNTLVAMPITAYFQEPPPLYTSGVNGPSRNHDRPY
jgi:hypothetical protein